MVPSSFNPPHAASSQRWSKAALASGKWSTLVVHFFLNPPRTGTLEKLVKLGLLTSLRRMVAAQQELCGIEEFVSALAAAPAPELGLIELQLQ
ncbi:hypothetical protein LTR70_006076 [Exophiala xenobiotica]|uniref:Uncharacterized protein n=1 Tax=Lithohypha guttulata TaxID=1690604 RepID=A0ABR0KDR8_9EURO|nr:hypothetical protein LTR24_004020 [Lithohypha guttulata]KAK5316943.1 hypothetical protein LTR70_006076 [Exophiala xenobiotica]